MLRKDRVVLLLGSCMVYPRSLEHIGVNAMNFEQTPLSSGVVEYDGPVGPITQIDDNNEKE